MPQATDKQQGGEDASKNNTSAEQQLSGKQLDEALLEKVVSDNSPGEAAAVLREVARLHQENSTLKKRNVRVWSLALFMGASFTVAASSALFLFPKYRYIPTRDNRALCEVSSDAHVRITAAALAEFAKDTAIEAYTYDYVNYRTAINEVAMRRFTDSGRKQYLASLQESGNLERVIKGRLVLRAMATRTAQIEEEGRRGMRRFWVVRVPIAVEFYSGGEANPRSRQDFLAQVTILESEASASNLRGIAVDSLVLSPTTTPR